MSVASLRRANIGSSKGICEKSSPLGKFGKLDSCCHGGRHAALSSSFQNGAVQLITECIILEMISACAVLIRYLPTCGRRLLACVVCPPTWLLRAYMRAALHALHELRANKAT